jgi:DNA-binding transcriptional ArsR family regulator
LEIAQPNGWTQDIQLDGRGLVIVSSVFLSSTPRLFVDAHSRDHSPVLAYPTPLDIMSAMALWDPRLCNDRALGALVGRTRAAILEALTETYTTSQLGRKVGVSAAAASQHTAVLREAGLIMTRRKQNKVLHTVTGLGSALIKGNDLGEKGVVAPA